MRRTADDEVAAAARRRLELLRAELGLDTQPKVPTGSEGPEEPEVVGPPSPAGRHLRRKVSATHLLAGWVADRLPAGLRGRVTVGVRELTLIGLVVLVGVVVAVVVVLRSGGGEVAAAPLVDTPVAPATPSALVGPAAVPSRVPATATSTGAATDASAGRVVVDVTGKVRDPGVLRLPQGSRVIDAVRRAGGARRGVDLSSLNLARLLTDGEQIVVGETTAAAMATGPTGAASAAGPLVDINQATEEQLETLPGVGPVTAQKILAWRQAHGAFNSVDELLEVDGIGDKTLADLTPYVTL